MQNVLDIPNTYSCSDALGGLDFIRQYSEPSSELYAYYGPKKYYEALNDKVAYLSQDESKRLKVVLHFRVRVVC